MLLLAYDGAMRREEVTQLAIDDFDIARRIVTIRAETSKSQRDRTVPYSAATQALLLRYLPERKAMGDRSDRLFLSLSNRNRGLPLSVYAWTKEVEGLAARSGVSRLTTHSMRHLRLTDLARLGRAVYEISSIAGHSSLLSTRVYIHLSARDLCVAYARTEESLQALRYPRMKA